MVVALRTLTLLAGLAGLVIIYNVGYAVLEPVFGFAMDLMDVLAMIAFGSPGGLFMVLVLLVVVSIGIASLFAHLFGLNSNT